MSNELKKQSNPFSTGGGGVNFETRVQASFALAIYTQSFLPCVPLNMVAIEIRFQNKYAGINTDDFVLIASNANQKISKLYAQIKHDIVVSDSLDSEFSGVIKAAWADFKNSEFDKSTDNIALITGPLTRLDVRNVLPLLEWAKHSSDAKDFLAKSKMKGFTSESKLKKLAEIRNQLKNANSGTDLDDYEFWSFLKCFSIITYDLDSTNSIVAGLLCAQIQNHSTHLPHLVLSELINVVQKFNQNAGVLSKTNTPVELLDLFDISNTNHTDIDRLIERGNYVSTAISNTIKNYHVSRDDQLSKLNELYDEFDFIFVTGLRGVGKSGLVKTFLQSKSDDVPVFYLRAEDLDKSHLQEVFHSIGVKSSLSAISSRFALLKDKILVIESVEKVLELSNQNAFADLLQFLKAQTGWKIIVTGREYAYQQLAFNYLQPAGVMFETLNVGSFSDSELDQLSSQIPEIKQLVTNESLSELLKIPFFLQIAVRALTNGASFKDDISEEDFRKVVWNSVIAKDLDRKAGMPARRKTTFIEIAKQRAKQMVFGVKDSNYDPEVVSKLEEDSLLSRDDKYGFISPTHDVLEDWALEEFIEIEFMEKNSEAKAFLSAIGSEPSINRAFRLWLTRRLKTHDDFNEFINQVLISNNVESYWKDETIAAMLLSESTHNSLTLLKDNLLQDDCALLIRFYFILRIACQHPSSIYNYPTLKNQIAGVSKSLILEPYGKGWDALIEFSYDHRSSLTDTARNHLIDVLYAWSELITIHDEDLPKNSAKVGLLVLENLEPLKDTYRRGTKRERLIGVLLKVAPSIQNEFDDLLNREVFVSKKSRRLGYVDELTNMSLIGSNVPMLCKRLPEFVKKLAMHEWIRPEEKYSDEFPQYQHFADLEDSYGLDNQRDFFPASGAKGPFKYLFNFHPRFALDFLIEFLNKTAQAHADSEFAKDRGSGTEFDEMFSGEIYVHQFELTMNDGVVIKQYASPHLWNGYRGTSTLPYLIQCALMAFEGWLISNIEKLDDTTIEWLFDYTLRSSNSVMATSVLASIATGYPAKVKKAAFPLLRCPHLYEIDLHRTIKELGSAQPNWFGGLMDRDVLSEIYRKERVEASTKPWRKQSLESVLINLQFNEECRAEVFKIHDELTQIAQEENWESLKFMVHRSNTRTWEAEADPDNNRILLKSNSELPEDLMRATENYQSRRTHDFLVMKLNAWANKKWKNETIDAGSFETTEEALSGARKLYNALKVIDEQSFRNLAIGGIAISAAVAIRDASESLSTEDKKWCQSVITHMVGVNADITASAFEFDTTDYQGVGSCAYVIPKLLTMQNTSKRELKFLQNVLLQALTHENIIVGEYAAQGISEYLWSSNSELASRCLSFVLAYSKFKKSERKQKLIRNVLTDSLEDQFNNWITKKLKFRKTFKKFTGEIEIESTLENYAINVILIAMKMIPSKTNCPEHMLLINKLVSHVYASEYLEQNDKQLDPQFKKRIIDTFAEHLISSKDESFKKFSDLLIQGCSIAPSVVYMLKLRCHVELEKVSDFKSIWALWAVLATEAKKIAHGEINGNKHRGRLNEDLVTLLRGLLYADCPWQNHGSEDMAIQQGYDQLMSFFEECGHNKHVFEALASLVNQFPKLFFEKGIFVLAEKFEEDNELAKRSNSAFYLEMSITRYMQIENRGVLSRKMYTALLTLLTGIVETGSARAYYIRENLIRSRKIAH